MHGRLNVAPLESKLRLNFQDGVDMWKEVENG